MPSIYSEFPSSYLKAADLGRSRVHVIIDRLVMEDIGGEMKPVLHFEGKDRGLVLNKTNANTIVEVAGTDEYLEWPGTHLRLFATTTDYAGKRVPCIRVEGDPGHPRAGVVPESQDGQPEDIPF